MILRANCLVNGLFRLVVDGAATGFCPASARHDLDVGTEMIIDKELFAGLEGALGHVQNVAVGDQRPDVGFAGMVNVLGPATVHGTIQAPVLIEGEDVVERTFVSPALSFAAADALSAILDHFAARRNVLLGKETPAVDSRRFDAELIGAVSLIQARLLGFTGDSGFS